MTRTKLRIVLLALVGSILVVSAPVNAADDPVSVSERSALESPDPVSEVWLSFTGSEQLNAAASAGIDVEHNIVRVPTGMEGPAIVTQDQIAQLEAMGVAVISEADRFKWDLSPAAGPSSLRSGALGSSSSFGLLGTLSALVDEPTVRIVRADYFTTKGQGFLYVEARTTLGQQSSPVITMQLANDTGTGTPFGTESQHEQVHRFGRVHVPPEPREGGRPAESDPRHEQHRRHRHRLRLGLARGPGRAAHRHAGLQVRLRRQLQDRRRSCTARFEEIADQYPRIAEIVELPNRTNGYQRQAQATIGGTGQAAVVVTSAAWGHEGGNDITVRFVNPGVANSPLSVLVLGKAITVSLATGSTGALTSTAAQVAAAILAQSGGLIARSHPYRNNAGTGIVQPTATTVALTDFLSVKRTGAPAGDPARGPFTVRALRIGKFRNGTKPGVLIQAQDHAREWVPATITLESAERLVQNYATDQETRKIVDNTDLFLIPSNNPDGNNYSMYNFASQRRNMTNHCPNTSADPGNRNAWGVDLNRNYRFASGFDGYDGASTSCTSDTFQGPSKLSEPESKNIIWLAENFPNIKFMMSVHSNGGQLFWQPGAYIANGRITAPRPPLGHEAFYWQSASRILSQVKAERQTVVTPENVGGSADVLYSSAGNVREDLYNNHGVFAFGWEVGGSVYNTATGNFVDGSFQPAWVGNPDIVSGHSETMEYANGVMEMFRIAAEWGKDRVRPKTQLVPGQGRYTGPVDLHFETNEPAEIYYTTDGSVPTLQSARYKATEFREPGQTFNVTETTIFKWFSVDTSGNFERGFDPDNPGANYRQAEIRIPG